MPPMRPASAAGVRRVGREMVEEQILDITPMLVGDPVRSALELEKLVVAGAVLGRQISCLTREDRILVAPDMQHRGPLTGAEWPRSVPNARYQLQRAAGTDRAQCRDIAMRMRRAETGRGQERLCDDPARSVDQRFRDDREPEHGDVRHAQTLLRALERLSQRPRMRRRDRGERCHCLRMVTRKRPRNHATPVVAGQVEAFTPQGGRDGEDVSAQLTDAIGRRLRQEGRLGSNHAGSGRQRDTRRAQGRRVRRASRRPSAGIRGAAGRAPHLRDHW